MCRKRRISLSGIFHFTRHAEHYACVRVRLIYFPDKRFIPLFILLRRDPSLHCASRVCDCIFTVYGNIVCSKHNEYNVRTIPFQPRFDLMQRSGDRRIGYAGIQYNIIRSAGFIQIFCKHLRYIVVSLGNNAMRDAVAHKQPCRRFILSKRLFDFLIDRTVVIFVFCCGPLFAFCRQNRNRLVGLSYAAASGIVYIKQVLFIFFQSAYGKFRIPGRNFTGNRYSF